MFEPVRALPTVAVSDMDRAKQFYGDVLGLKVDQERPDGVLYEAGGGSLILVYVSQFAGTAQSMSGIDLDVVDVTAKLTPGQTSASIQASSTGRRSASSASLTAAVASHPMWARSSVSAVVANRVCTTERSSANGSRTTASAAEVIGLFGSPTTATEGIRPRASSRTWSTSVVVPDRLMTTTES